MKTFTIGASRIWISRRLIGVQCAGRFQLDFMPGRWRVLSYRRGIRKPGHHSLDLGRIGIFRYARFQEDQ